ncbi:MAG TPA: hypothetical protein VGD66_09105 [Allosphingosinicella sp.]|jgi:hypothetical protein
MTFFIPCARDGAEAEQVFESVRTFLAEQGLPTERRRVRRLDYRIGGEDQSVEIGDLVIDREPAFLILRAADEAVYYVCTPNWGVLRGEPWQVDDDEHTRAEDFEAGEVAEGVGVAA